jgi:hypothetical protein
MPGRHIGYVAIALAALVTLGGLIAVASFLRVPPFRPALTCALSDPKPCHDTLVWVGGFDPDWALYPPLPGRITAIEVRPAPVQWKSSLDPGFQGADWAAVLERDGYEPVVAACYYASGDEVACHTEEVPFTSPSP